MMRYYKKIILTAIAAVICAALCSCGNSDGEITSAGDNSNTSNSISEADHVSEISLQETETSASAESAEEFADETENPYSAVQEQYSEKSDELQRLYSSISEEKTLPVINITTENEEKILSKDEYVKSVIDVFNCGGKYTLSAEGGVKVRGNSTAEQGDEKPYRIKFEKKHNMLGLHGGREYKSWVLLRSYWNLAPDYMAFSLAEAIFDGKYYSSDCTYVNLYLNGEYAGMYLLCEQNQAADGRVDVYEPTAEETQTDIGYLVELDNYADEEHPYFKVGVNNAEFTDINGETRVIEDKDYSIKSDTNTDEQRAFIEKYLNGVFKILFEAVSNDAPMMFDDDYNVVSAEDVYSNGYEAVSAVIDLESAANMLILEELVHNYDVGAGSFYLSVDFSEYSIYPKLTFLAPWDFNWAYNDSPNEKYYAGAFQDIMHDGEDRSNYWFTILMKADWFQIIVKEKWQLLENGSALTEVTAQVKSDLELLRNDLGENQWSIDTANAMIVDFVNERIKWLDEQWR